MLFDSHAHLNFEAFANKWQVIADDCIANDVWVNIVGSQFSTSQKAIMIAEHYPQGMYATVGLHPVHVPGSVSNPENFDPVDYQTLIDSSKKVVAVGETGIDFYHQDNNFENQQTVFIQHVELARKNNLAVVIHGRNSRDGQKNAYAAILEILNHYPVERGVAHCFGGTLAEARAFVEQGLYIGFTGIVTFKNAHELQTIAKTLPLEKILIETDAPYLAPEPFRGKENQPQYVEYVAAHIAKLKGISYNEVVGQTSHNAQQLFGLNHYATT